jgi:acetolactate synthase I/II/III large subunit
VGAVTITGAEVITRFLADYGVEYVFGYPGGAVLHIYDALYKQDAVKHILTRHEQGALHAADGYARTTGRPGVALVTSGPGATNAITGIATAYMDSIPMVVITGQVPTPLIGNDAFQEVDAVGITRPCVKHNFLVTDAAKLPETLAKAFYLATTGRPGPVVIDVPKDITAAAIDYEYPQTVAMRSYNPTTRGHARQIRRAVDEILEAKHPVLYTGGGVVLGNASDALVRFAQALNIPVTSTTMGLGAYPASDRQFLGMLGMHGTYEANMSMHHCDLLVAVGARFDDRVTGNVEKFCPNAYIIHIDIDPSSISKNVKVDVPIVGEVGEVLEGMNQYLGENTHYPQMFDSWWQDIQEWRSYNCLNYETRPDVIKPQQAIEMLHRVTGGNAIICSDVGQHQMWAAQFYKFDRPRRWVNSGGLGTMGFGFPAAIGAKLAFPEDDVWVVTSEGSIQMNIQELATCKEYGIPVKILNLNNQYLGMVRQWQEFFYDKRYAESVMEFHPDFIKLAESYSHVGMRIDDPNQLEAQLTEANNRRDDVVFVDVIVDRDENVYPMVPAGAGLNEMILL